MKKVGGIVPRRLSNWIHSYLEYIEGTESPKLFHFWIAVSTLAGALRKRVWLDMIRFQWSPNFYIILVAPPGVATKTTTLDLGHSFLREIPGINFGPDIITWQGLVKRFSESGETFEYNNQSYPMSALTVGSGELGNLLNPEDIEMVNLLITLWDGRSRIDKETKTAGSESIIAPWINLAGCTTPDWISSNVPPSMVGGGFISRCIFVYRDKKEHLIAWPDEVISSQHTSLRESLLEDLTHIATNLLGPMTVTADAREWVRQWYNNLWTMEASEASDDVVKGYLARKQGHLVKTAMILSIAKSDSLILEKEDFQLANEMLKEVESSYLKVFSRVGQSPQAVNVGRVLEIVRRRKTVPFPECYETVHIYFPDPKEFITAIEGLVKAGKVKYEMNGGVDMMKANIVYITG